MFVLNYLSDATDFRLRLSMTANGCTPTWPDCKTTNCKICDYDRTAAGPGMTKSDFPFLLRLTSAAEAPWKLDLNSSDVRAG